MFSLDPQKVLAPRMHEPYYGVQKRWAATPLIHEPSLPAQICQGDQNAPNTDSSNSDSKEGHLPPHIPLACAD